MRVTGLNICIQIFVCCLILFCGYLTVGCIAFLLLSPLLLWIIPLKEDIKEYNRLEKIRISNEKD